MMMDQYDALARRERFHEDRYAILRRIVDERTAALGAAAAHNAEMADKLDAKHAECRALRSEISAIADQAQPIEGTDDYAVPKAIIMRACDVANV